MTSKEPAGLRQTQNTGPCSCGACGEHFRALYAFDRHRVGVWPNRGCLDVAGLEGIGFKQDQGGRWYKPNLTGGAPRRGIS